MKFWARIYFVENPFPFVCSIRTNFFREITNLAKNKAREHAYRGKIKVHDEISNQSWFIY